MFRFSLHPKLETRIKFIKCYITGEVFQCIRTESNFTALEGRNWRKEEVYNKSADIPPNQSL